MYNAGTAVERVMIMWETPQEWPQAQKVLAALLNACERSLSEHNPNWLGHCKALIEAAGAAAYGSITGADEPLSWRGALREPITQATITLYCVVYALPDEIVATSVRGAIQRELPAAHPAPLPDQERTGTLELL